MVQITKEHGGQLKVETKEGEGAEFIIIMLIAPTYIGAKAINLIDPKIISY